MLEKKIPVATFILNFSRLIYDRLIEYGYITFPPLTLLTQLKTSKSVADNNKFSVSIASLSSLCCLYRVILSPTVFWQILFDSLNHSLWLKPPKALWYSLTVSNLNMITILSIKLNWEFNMPDLIHSKHATAKSLRLTQRPNVCWPVNGCIMYKLCTQAFRGLTLLPKSFSISHVLIAMKVW